MADDVVQMDVAAPKKVRKRLKTVFQQLIKQVEFYLSDANLSKDRFFKQLIQKSAEGFVDLDVFLRCNKVRAITTDMSVLVKALGKSQVLQLSDNKQQVRRVQPFVAVNREDVDARTVYVECLPATADQEYLTGLFSDCGTVVYVSLPRYKSSGDKKGFAFIEFDTQDAAIKACKKFSVVSTPPISVAEKAGKFPRTSKQMKALDRQFYSHGLRPPFAAGRKRRASESMAVAELSLERYEKRRRRTVSEGPTDGQSSQDTAVENTTAQLGSSETPVGEGQSTATSGTVTSVSALLDSPRKRRFADRLKRVRERSNSEEAASDKQSDTKVVSAVETSKVEKKRKKAARKKCKSEKTVNIGAVTIVSEVTDTCLSDPVKTTDISVNGAKPGGKSGRKRKRRSASKEEKDIPTKVKKLEDETEDAGAVSVNVADENLPVKTEPLVNSDNTAAVVKLEKTEQRKRRRQRKRKKGEEKTPKKEAQQSLRVMPKSEWLQLRAEFLVKQKATMSKMKQVLREVTQQQQVQQQQQQQQHHEKSGLQFMPGVIVKVTAEQPLTRLQIKDLMSCHGDVAYIDVKDTDPVSYVRCADAKSALTLSTTSLAGCSTDLLTGTEETEYWNKIISDREKKLGGHKQKKKQQRGKDKLVKRADKLQAAVDQKKHIVFDDT